MKIKLDECLSVKLAQVLERLGHDVETVSSEGLTGHADTDVWHAAQTEGRFLITEDLDFADIRRFARGQHAGVLVLRLQTPGIVAICRRLEALFTFEDIEDWRSCLVVATDTKLRIRR